MAKGSKSGLYLKWREEERRGLKKKNKNPWTWHTKIETIVGTKALKETEKEICSCRKEKVLCLYDQAQQLPREKIIIS